jgi:hypothetical protein
MGQRSRAYAPEEAVGGGGRRSLAPGPPVVDEQKVADESPRIQRLAAGRAACVSWPTSDEQVFRPVSNILVPKWRLSPVSALLRRVLMRRKYLVLFEPRKESAIGYVPNRRLTEIASAP